MLNKYLFEDIDIKPFELYKEHIQWRRESQDADHPYRFI